MLAINIVCVYKHIIISYVIHNFSYYGVCRLDYRIAVCIDVKKYCKQYLNEGSGYVAEHFRSSNFAFPQVFHLGLELGLVLGLGLGSGLGLGLVLYVLGFLALHYFLRHYFLSVHFNVKCSAT